jgi:hypothetical protein
LSTRPPSIYRIHGLVIESEIPLDERAIEREADGRTADPQSGDEADPLPDYRVVAGEPRACPDSPPPGRMLAEIPDDGFRYWAVETRRDPGRWTLRYAGICEATLDSGTRTIVVHPASEADPGLIPIFVEGNVLAHALAADGLLALHASAVELGGRALAIVGPSGTGKSTLAALLCAAGARLVADDVLRVDATGSGAICFPGTRGLRLRPAATSLKGRIHAAAVEETADGRTRVLPTQRADGPLKLYAAIVPEPSREAKRLEVRRLGAMEGLQELLRHPRLGAWRAREPIARLFELTAEVAPTLAVYRARIPWGPPFQPALAEEILASVGIRAASRPGTPEPGAAVGSDRHGAA